jgi:hypothetical protein
VQVQVSSASAFRVTVLLLLFLLLPSVSLLLLMPLFVLPRRDFNRYFSNPLLLHLHFVNHRS